MPQIFCEHYCSHGGRCDLEPGHEGNHDSSGRCTWTSEESITREEADGILASVPGGAEFLRTDQVILDMLEEDS